jgi:hypothetical protein
MATAANKFRKRPVIIEAMQVPKHEDPLAWGYLVGFLNGGANWEVNSVAGIHIHTLEGTMFGEVGDWIIKGVKGEFYPCKPDIFAETYEAVAIEEQPSTVVEKISGQVKL